MNRWVICVLLGVCKAVMLIMSHACYELMIPKNDLFSFLFFSFFHLLLYKDCYINFIFHFISKENKND
jgi:hypothetical protein